ncbi:MAG TPA: SRPBCC family protein [Streptosporangiaceae bacterium]
MGSKTSSSIQVAAPTADVMDVIADFAEYPRWATALRSAEVLETGPDGRAGKVRFTLDAGVLRDTYVLSYTWDGDTQVTWRLAEPGSVISEMTGGYQLADRDPGGAAIAGLSGQMSTVSYELTVDVRIPMPGLLKRRAEKMIIDTALKGLKARAESLSRAERDSKPHRECGPLPGSAHTTGQDQGQSNQAAS